MRNGRINERNTGHITLDGAPKQRRVRSPKITPEEMRLVSAVLEKLLDCMQYDEALSNCGHLSPNAKYTDGGRFGLTLTREQFELLCDFTHKVK